MDTPKEDKLSLASEVDRKVDISNSFSFSTNIPHIGMDAENVFFFLVCIPNISNKVVLSDAAVPFPSSSSAWLVYSQYPLVSSPTHS